MCEIFQKLGGFLFNPVITFKKSRDDSFSDALQYYLILLVFDTLVTSFFFILTVKDNLPFITPITLGPAFFALNLCILVIVGVVLHAVTFVLGGRRGIVRTFISLFYSSTPLLLTSWLIIILSNFGPFGLWSTSLLSLYCVGISGWTLILLALGLSEVQELSLNRAFFAAIGTAVLVLVVVAAITLFIFVFSWAEGYGALFPYHIRIERTGENLTFTNNGGKGIPGLSKIEVIMNGIPQGDLGTGEGSVITLSAPSCPSGAKVFAVFGDGTRRELPVMKDDDQCPNTITNLTITKIGNHITVQNNGGPGLDRVTAFYVQLRNGTPNALGKAPGDKVVIVDPSCSGFLTVTAVLNNGASWRLHHEYLSNCSAVNTTPAVLVNVTSRQSDNIIRIINGRFVPNYIVIHYSFPLGWISEDETEHKIVSDAFQKYPEGAIFSSGVMGKGGRFTATFPTWGEYHYHCTIHPNETGIVEVVVT